MRSFILSLFCIAGLVGCGTKYTRPVSPPIVSVKPSTTEVKGAIKKTKTQVESANTSIDDATNRTTKVTEIIKVIEKTIDPEKLKELNTELDSLKKALFKAKADLRDAQDSLNDSNEHIAKLDAYIEVRDAELKAFKLSNEALVKFNSEVQDTLIKTKANEAVWRTWAWRWGISFGTLCLLIGLYFYLKRKTTLPIP